MVAAVLARGAGAVVLTGPPERPRPRRAAEAIAGFAPNLVGPAYIVGSCVSLQTAAALATTVFATFGIAATGALRFLAAALVLLTVVRPRLRGRTRREWLTIAALGTTSATTNFCLYEAIARIPLGVAGTLVFLGPLAVALIGTRRLPDIARALLALAGVILLTEGPSATSHPGIAFALGAALTVAASIVLARRVGAHTNGLDGVALSISVAALLTLPVGLPAAVATPHIAGFAVVLAVGVLGIAVPYGLEFSALRRLGVRTYSILLSLDPAIAGLVGLLLLGQRLSFAEVLGIGLVMVATTGAVASQSAC
jgi:inner membrane transporter RhtA